MSRAIHRIRLATNVLVYSSVGTASAAVVYLLHDQIRQVRQWRHVIDNGRRLKEHVRKAGIPESRVMWLQDPSPEGFVHSQLARGQMRLDLVDNTPKWTSSPHNGQMYHVVPRSASWRRRKRKRRKAEDSSSSPATESHTSSLDSWPKSAAKSIAKSLMAGPCLPRMSGEDSITGSLGRSPSRGRFGTQANAFSLFYLPRDGFQRDTTSIQQRSLATAATNAVSLHHDVAFKRPSDPNPFTNGHDASTPAPERKVGQPKVDVQKVDPQKVGLQNVDLQYVDLQNVDLQKVMPVIRALRISKPEAATALVVKLFWSRSIRCGRQQREEFMCHSLDVLGDEELPTLLLPDSVVLRSPFRKSLRTLQLSRLRPIWSAIRARDDSPSAYSLEKKEMFLRVAIQSDDVQLAASIAEDLNLHNSSLATDWTKMLTVMVAFAKVGNITAV